MRLKKLLVLSLAAVMGLSLVACGSKSDDSGKEKTYKIASDTTFAPFEFENKDGERVGIDLELLEAIADEEGFKYEIDAVGFDAAMASVENGQSDGMIAGMSITDERKEKYDFSYYLDDGYNKTDNINDCVKVVVLVNDRFEDAKRMIKEFDNKKVYAYLSTKHVNIIDSSVNKKSALEKVLVHADCYKDDLYVIGDSVNDLEMLTAYQGGIMKEHSIELDDLPNRQYDTLYEYIEELEKN